MIRKLIRVNFDIQCGVRNVLWKVRVTAHQNEVVIIHVCS